ncbi:MAG: transglycosylase SLT domain-containing protein [Desulfovibrionaceae bacterium]|nr:transglycosylase SLT domain-containing protein [Desulfovibrionaceae bacterium]
MTRRKTLAILSAGLGGGLLLLGLLTGFVPQSDGPELRRRASTQVVSLRPEDMPAPIEAESRDGRFLAIRCAVDVAAVPPQERTAAQSPAGPTAQIVSFEAGGVRLEMGREEIFYRHAGEAAPLTPLLALDGASMPPLLTDQPRQYGDSLDAQGRPLRWQAEEKLLTGYMPRAVRVPDMSKLVWHTPSGDVLAKAAHYRELVETFSRRYGLDTDLIFAIIHSESSFRPSLVSGRSAMGLMQLLPSTAGGEVHRFLYGRSSEVGFEDLCVPEVNIRYGTAYLHILMTRYFQDVRDPLSREYCVVAAYNMGPNRLLRVFGASHAEAVARINSMDAAELYEELTARLPIRETRFYVAKVQRMKGHFAAELD